MKMKYRFLKPQICKSVQTIAWGKKSNVRDKGKKKKQICIVKLSGDESPLCKQHSNKKYI